MAKGNIHIQSLKTISSIFNNPNFNRIAREGDSVVVERRIAKFLSYNTHLMPETYNKFFEDLYTSMLKQYRNEFVYKNEIVNKILLGRHSLNTTTVLNEFQIGKSKADLVMLNGTSVVYEIKTEYDSPERLLNQIQNYRKAFLNIVIVTHHTVQNKYLKFIKEHNLDKIGLLVYTKNNALREVIKPEIDANHLDITTMFKCLRMKEFSDVIHDYYGFIPDVPNGRFFKACLEKAKEIAPFDFHNLMFAHLKKRNVSDKNLISSGKIPIFLKHISICADFKNEDFLRIDKFLKRTL